MSKRKNATFTFTEHQLQWIENQSQRTGLLKTEIVRRAVDEHREREDAKAEEQLFTPEQWQDIQEIARSTGRSKTDVARRAVDRERNRFFRRY